MGYTYAIIFFDVYLKFKSKWRHSTFLLAALYLYCVSLWPLICPLLKFNPATSKGGIVGNLPRTGVVDSCELPCECWEPNLGVRKSNKCSQPLRHLFSPPASFLRQLKLTCLSVGPPKVGWTHLHQLINQDNPPLLRPQVILIEAIP